MDVLPNMVRLVANHANLVVRNISGMSDAKIIINQNVITAALQTQLRK